MARVTVEDCLEIMPNRFTLVILVARRVRQLIAGDTPLLESDNKQVVTALREVAASKVALNMSSSQITSHLEGFLGGLSKEEPQKEEASSSESE